MCVEFTILGSIEIRTANQVVQLGPKKETGLLAFLTCRLSQWVRREEVARLLWEHSDQRRRRHSLSQALYSLRRRVPTLKLSLERDRIRLTARQFASDIDQFRTAAKEGNLDGALHHYGGPFLEGLWIQDAPAFARWQEETRLHLSEKAASLARLAMKRAECGGSWTKLRDIATRLLDIKPYSVAGHHARLTAIAMLGEPDRALDEYYRVREALRSQLGRDSTPALDGLLEELRRAPKLPYVLEPPEEGIPTPFVGREEEFQSLRNAWQFVQQGTGRTVAVIGEAGIGKTRLCDRFLRLTVLQGARVLQGRCYPGESQVPYGGLVDALIGNLESKDIQGLPPAWLDVIGELLPEVVPKQSQSARPIEPDSARRRLFEALARLLEHLSTTTPVALFLDDFHWVDRTTAALMHYLARRLSESHILIIVAAREDEPANHKTVDAFLHHGEPPGYILKIQLGELQRTAAKDLIDAYSQQADIPVPEDIAATICEQIGGRPFFILEALRAIGSGEIDISGMQESVAHFEEVVLLPTSAEEFLANRVRDLDGLAAMIIGSMAVIGRESHADVLREICNLTPDDFVTGLELLGRLRMVAFEEERVRFSHDLIRVVAYRALSAPRRRLLHERAATSLSSDSATPAGTIALHYDAAGRNGKAFTFAMAAADASENVYAHNEHEFFLRMALGNAPEGADQFAVQQRLATLLFRLRRYVEADMLLRSLETSQALNHSNRLQLSIDRAAVHVKRATLPPVDTLERLERLLDKAQTLNARQSISRILTMLVEVAHDAGDRDQIVKAIDRLLTVAKHEHVSSVGVHALCSASVVSGLYIDLPMARELADKALDHARRVEQPEPRLRAMSTLAVVHLQLGNLTVADSLFQSAFDIAEQAAIIQYNHSLMTNSGVCLLERGEYDNAEVVFRKALELAHGADANVEVPVIYQNLSALYLERHEYPLAVDSCTHILEIDAATRPWWSNVLAWGILGLCALRRGNFTEANRYRRDIVLRFEEHNFWVSDFSYVETFLARMAEMDDDIEGGLARLERAIDAYEGRDALCRARLQLERTRLLTKVDVDRAREAAAALRTRAAEMGARPIVDKVDRLVTRMKSAGG